MTPVFCEIEYPAHNFVTLSDEIKNYMWPDPKFELGEVVMTPNVSNKMVEDTAFSVYVSHCVTRHTKCDWGDMTDEDKNMNDDAIRTGQDRIFSAYENKERPDWRIWIITEWDHSRTTVLFPDEY